MHEKKYILLRALIVREIETSILREIIDEPMFLASPKENLH